MTWKVISCREAGAQDAVRTPAGVFWLHAASPAHCFSVRNLFGNGHLVFSASQGAPEGLMHLLKLHQWSLLQRISGDYRANANEEIVM